MRKDGHNPVKSNRKGKKMTDEYCFIEFDTVLELANMLRAAEQAYREYEKKIGGTQSDKSEWQAEYIAHTMENLSIPRGFPGVMESAEVPAYRHIEGSAEELGHPLTGIMQDS